MGASTTSYPTWVKLVVWWCRCDSIFTTEAHVRNCTLLAVSVAIALALESQCLKNRPTMGRLLYKKLTFLAVLRSIAKWGKPTWRLSLRLVPLLAVSIGLVVVVWLGGRSMFVQHLAHRIERSDDTTAAQLVRHLAQFKGEASSALVEAANSPRSVVAINAQREIDSLVDHWRRKAYLRPATFPLRSTALQLAKAIDQQAAQLRPSSRRWARQTLEHLLEMAREQPPSDRLVLIQTCEKALAQLPPDESTPTMGPSIDFGLVLDRRASKAPPSQPAAPTRTTPLTMTPPLATAPISPAPLPADAFPNVPVLPAPVTLPPTATTSAPAATSPEWNPNWGLAAAPTRPVNLPPPATDSNPPLTEQPPAMMPVGEARPLVKPDEPSEERWFTELATGKPEQQELAMKQLHQLGFGYVTPRDARMLRSASLRDRLELLNVAMTSPRLEASKWLWRLAHDRSGEVRAAAIASIAISDDIELMKAAMEMALRDTDPRVAKQTATLRQRLR